MNLSGKYIAPFFGEMPLLIIVRDEVLIVEIINQFSDLSSLAIPPFSKFRRMDKLRVIHRNELIVNFS